MNPKPIFLIGIPGKTTEEQLQKMRDDLMKRIDDYHIVMYATMTDEYEFKIIGYERD